MIATGELEVRVHGPGERSFMPREPRRLALVRGSFLHARLQIAVPHKCDRCIDLKEALVEPLSLCSTLRQDEGGPLPLVGAKNILGQ